MKIVFCESSLRPAHAFPPALFHLWSHKLAYNLIHIHLEMPTIEDIDIGMEASDPDAGSGDPSPPKPPQLEILSAEDDDDEVDTEFTKSWPWQCR